MKQNRNLTLKSWGFALIFNLIIFVACRKAYNFIYYVNDDQYFNLIVEKAFGNTSTGMVCINIFLSSIMKVFYAMLPRFNWYVIILYGIMITSWISISAVIISKIIKTKSVITTIGLILIIGFFAVYSYVNFNFTQTSMVAIIAGFLLLIKNSKYQTELQQGLINNSIDKITLKLTSKSYKFLLWCENILGILLVIFGVFIRYECIFAIAPLFVMYAVYTYFVAIKNNKLSYKEATLGFWKLKKSNGVIKYQLLYLSLIFGALLLSFFVIFINNFWFTTDSDWKEYTKFNNARVRTYDYGLFKSDNPEDALDYSMFYNGLYGLNSFMADNEVFTSSKLEKWTDIEPIKPTVQQMHTKWESTLKGYLKTETTRYYLILTFIIFAMLILFNKKRLPGILVLVYYASIYGIMLYRGRIKIYVDWGIFLAIAVFALSIFENGIVFTWIKKLYTYILKKCHIQQYAVIIATLIIAYTMSYPIYYQKNIEKEKTRQSFQQTPHLNNYLSQVTADKSNLYLLDTYTFLQYTWTYDMYSVNWRSYVEEDTFNNVIITSGWDTNSKRMKETMRRYNTNNAVRALIEKDNVFLISTGTIEEQKYLVDFLSRHYQYKGTPHLVKEVGTIKTYSFR